MSPLKSTCFLLALGLMIITVALLLWFKTHQRLGEPGLRMAGNDPELPAQVLDYQSTPVEMSPAEVTFLPKDTRFARRLYRWEEQGQTNQIQLSVVLMGTDRTSIHKPQFCLVGQGWSIDQSDHLTIPVKSPHPYDLPVMRLTATKIYSTNGTTYKLRGVYTYWFVAKDRLTSDHWQRMVWIAKDLLLRGELQRWAYVSCFTTCWPGQEEATYDRLRNFVAAAVPQFQLATLPSQARAGAPPLRQSQVAAAQFR